MISGPRAFRRRSHIDDAVILAGSGDARLLAACQSSLMPKPMTPGTAADAPAAAMAIAGLEEMASRDEKALRAVAI